MVRQRIWSRQRIVVVAPGKNAHDDTSSLDLNAAPALHEGSREGVVAFISKARLVLARSLIGRKDIAAAQRELEVLEKSGIDAAPFHTTRGVLELVRRNPEAARRALDRALAIAPADTEALSLLTRLDLQADRRAQALARVTAAVAQNQSSPAVLLLAARTQAATGISKRRRSWRDRL